MCSYNVVTDPILRMVYWIQVFGLAHIKLITVFCERGRVEVS